MTERDKDKQERHPNKPEKEARKRERPVEFRSEEAGGQQTNPRDPANGFKGE